MGPRTDLEMTLAPVILIFLACFNAWLFGDMAMLSEQSGQKANQFQQEVDVVNEAMKNFSLPRDIREDVRQFLT